MNINKLKGKQIRFNKILLENNFFENVIIHFILFSFIDTPANTNIIYNDFVEVIKIAAIVDLKVSWPDH